MLSLGHSIRKGNCWWNCFDWELCSNNNKKKSSYILSIKWLCNSNRGVYIKKWATKHVKQVLKCKDQTLSELDNCIYNSDVKVECDEHF